MASKKTQSLPPVGLIRHSSGRSSLRKVLPSLPDADAQLPLPLPITRASESSSGRILTSSASMPNPTSHNNGGETRDGQGASGVPHGQYFAPFLREYLVLHEFNLLQKQKMSGMYIVPSAKCPMHWFGVLFVRQGLYQEGVFRFHVFLPEDFPDGNCPRVVFSPPIFHPLIDPETGVMDVSKGFPRWRKGVHFVWQLLLYVRRAFYKLPTEGASDNLASQLLQTDMGSFKEEARKAVVASKEMLFSTPEADDPHYMHFTPYDPTTHAPTLQSIRQGQPHGKTMDVPSGLSWVESGTLQSFKLPAVQPTSDESTLSS